MRPEGGSKKKFYLLGTDYVFPRTANKILRAFLSSRGIPGSSIIEEYTPFGHSDYQEIVRKILNLGIAGDAAVLSTIASDSNIAFYQEAAAQGVRSSQIPIMAFSIAEDELRAMGPAAAMEGHLAGWNYFQSVDIPENRAFVEAFKRRYGATRVTDDPIEASYSGVYAWKAAVEKAGSFDVNRVREALSGLSFNAPAGAKRIDKENHHTAKPFYIGRIRADGQFDLIYKSPSLIEPESYSQYLASPRVNTPFSPPPLR
jgi:urea transport system substrate-binding protein